MALLILLALSPAFAATRNVPAQYATIQDAVNAAVNGDTVLVANGTYSGNGNRDIDFHGKNITVTSVNGPTKTIIDCGGSSSTDGSGNHRGFYLHSGETKAVISGFTVKNGYETYVSGVIDSDYGGGICIDGSSITLTNCTISNNIAGYVGVGGVFNYNSGSSTITLTNCICYGDTGGEIENDAQTTSNAIAAYCDIQGGYTGTGNIDAYPLFVNVELGDLHLRTASPCLGKGTDTGAPATDKDGNTRPNPPSIGAYEVTNTTVAASIAHVLWNNTNGTAAVWTVNANTNFTSSNYGPFPGWTAKAIADGPDGKTRLLWNNANGQVSVWTLNTSTSKYTSVQYGPYTGWSGKAIAVGPGSKPYLLWTNTNGQAALWNLSDATPQNTAHTYGPFTGWSAKSLSIGPDGLVHLLWTNTNGMAALWSVTATGAYTSKSYGPFSGWAALGIASGPDNVVRVLWSHASDNQMALWRVASGDTFINKSYGSYSGWTAVAVAAP